MGRRLKRQLALTLTVSLGLLVLSSLWHHDHSPLSIAIPGNDHQSAIAQTTHTSDYCPVCLSQRLLTHICLQAAAEAPAPVVRSHCAVSASSGPAASYAFHSDARAPPLC